MMEQDKKKGPVVLGLLALGAALCLSLAVHRTGGGAVAALAPAALPRAAAAPAAVLDGTAGKVIPLGKAVGIKACPRWRRRTEPPTRAGTAA